MLSQLPADHTPSTSDSHADAVHAEALRLAGIGCYVFPARVSITYRSGEWKKDVHPIADWDVQRTRNPDQINKWFGPGGIWQGASLCVATEPSGLAVVDQDGSAGITAWANLQAEHDIADTYRTRTPGGGEHSWYRGTIKNSAKKVAPTVDTRGRGGFVIVPPSTDDRGGYVALGDLFDLADLPEIPSVVVELAEAKRQPEQAPVAPAALTRPQPVSIDQPRRFTQDQARAFLAPYIDQLRAARNGSVNDTLNTTAKVASHFVPAFMDEQQCVEWVFTALRDNPDYDGNDEKSIGTIWSALNSRHGDWVAELVEDTPAEGDDDAFEKAVQDGLQKKRVTREIDRRLRAEERGVRSGGQPEPILLDAFLDQPDEDDSWRIEGLLGEGGRALLAAPAKAGKSTLMGNLLRSLADGDPFLGRFDVTPPTGRIVLIDTELGDRKLRRWLRTIDPQKRDRIAVISLRDRVASFDLLDNNVFADWVTTLQQLNAGFVVLDCLRPVLDSLGLDEKSEAGKFTTPFGELLSRGTPTGEGLVVHHMGHAGERARGDSSLLGWPDALWKVIRENQDDPASPRYFSAYGRDVDVPESLLAYNEPTKRLTIAGGNRKDSAAREALPAVLDYLRANPDQSGNAIEIALLAAGHTRGEIRGALKLAVREKYVSTRKGGTNATLHTLTGRQFASSPELAGVRQARSEEFASSPIELASSEVEVGEVSSPGGEVPCGRCKRAVAAASLIKGWCRSCSYKDKTEDPKNGEAA